MTNKQKKGKEINMFKSLARSNVFSTKSEEQEVNLVWPNLGLYIYPRIPKNTPDTQEYHLNAQEYHKIKII